MPLFNVKNRQRLSVIIPDGANNGKFFFEDNPKLRNTYADQEIITTGIKVFFRPQLDPAGNEKPGPPAISLTAARYAQFSLYSDGLFRIHNMPLTEIMNDQWGSVQVYHQRMPDVFEPMIVDFAKSFVSIAGAPALTIPAGGARVVFGIDFIHARKGSMAEYKGQVKYLQELALSGIK